MNLFTIKTTKLKLWLFAVALVCTANLNAQTRFNRADAVRRYNPVVTGIDSLSSLTLGNGNFAFTVDATGLQTFPQRYRNGIPLTTLSNWGWHDFENPAHIKAEDVRVMRQLQPNRKPASYADWNDSDAWQAQAAQWLIQNPNRLNLGIVGLNFEHPELIDSVHETLDLWAARVQSRFNYNHHHYEVQTVCDPDEDIMSSYIHADTTVQIVLRLPRPTGQCYDDAADYSHNGHGVTMVDYYSQGVVLRHDINDASYYISLHWTGRPRMKRTSDGLTLTSNDSTLQFYVHYTCQGEKVITADMPFADFSMAAAGQMAEYWTRGMFVDFNDSADSCTRQLAREVMLSRYLMGVEGCGMMPMQDTGLAYNSQYGKFNLCNSLFTMAHWAVWNYPYLLDNTLTWYLIAQPAAWLIAKRQGFAGARWMQTTDATYTEVPSHMGSYLIWQQPQPIILADMLLQSIDSTSADKQLILTKYGSMVEQTANFMSNFACRDSLSHCYNLAGYAAAGSTTPPAQTANTALELAMWHYALGTAQRWRSLMNYNRRPDWDSVATCMQPLPVYGASGYLPPTACNQPDTLQPPYACMPAALGVMSWLPHNGMVNDSIMLRTANYVSQHWPRQQADAVTQALLALTYARLNHPEQAAEALLEQLPGRKWLANGYYRRDARLRAYMPANGALLYAIGVMAREGKLPRQWHATVYAPYQGEVTALKRPISINSGKPVNAH